MTAISLLSLTLAGPTPANAVERMAPRSAAHPIQASGVVQQRPPGTRHGTGDAPRVLILSGDGGWNELERHLADLLVGKGLLVTGVDSRKTFNRPSEIEDIAGFIEGLVEHDAPLILVGYSFGADLLPLIWPHLSQDVRSRTLRVAMIAPSRDGSLSIDPSGEYDAGLMDLFPVAQTIRNAPRSRLVCIFGTDERASGYSSCPDPGFDPARRVELPGGHALNHDYEAIAAAIADESVLDAALNGP